MSNVGRYAVQLGTTRGDSIVDAVCTSVLAGARIRDMAHGEQRNCSG